MAGTLFGLPLSQQLDDNGNPQSGALLFVYAALTSTPASTFADSGLATLNSFPLECDASGRIPQFWVSDGSYRARLTTAAGVEIFDEDSILAIGPSVASSGGSGGGGGGGGGGTADSASIFTTGDMKWKPISGAETGWVRANGRTIGSASSGATERASSDTETLYGFLWNNFNNTLCPVTSGRGVGPTADFAANKSIATLDMRAYGIYGLDDMGNTAAGRLVTGSPTSAASSTGAEKTTLAEANLPAHTHAAGTFAASAHTHGAGTLAVDAHSHTAGTLAADAHSHGAGTYAVGTAINNGTQQLRNQVTSGNLTGGGGGNYIQSATEATISLTSGAVTGTSATSTATISGTSATSTATISGTSAASSTATVSGTSGSTGSTTAATTISPGRLGTWYIKL